MFLIRKIFFIVLQLVAFGASAELVVKESLSSEGLAVIENTGEDLVTLASKILFTKESKQCSSSINSIDGKIIIVNIKDCAFNDVITVGDRAGVSAIKNVVIADKKDPKLKSDNLWFYGFPSMNKSILFLGVANRSSESKIKYKGTLLSESKSKTSLSGFEFGHRLGDENNQMLRLFGTYGSMSAGENSYKGMQSGGIGFSFEKKAGESENLYSIIFSPSLGSTEGATPEKEGTMYDPTSMGLGITSISHGNISFETGFSLTFLGGDEYSSQGTKYENESHNYWSFSIAPVLGGEDFIFRPYLIYSNFGAQTQQSIVSSTNSYEKLEFEPYSVISVSIKATAIISETTALNLSFNPSNAVARTRYSDQTGDAIDLDIDTEGSSIVAEIFIRSF